MQETIQKLADSAQGIILLVVITVIGFNVAMTALAKCLGWIKDKTASKVDDRAYEIITRVLKALQVGLSWASANSGLFPAKVKAVLDKKEWDEQPQPKPNPSVPEAK